MDIKKALNEMEFRPRVGFLAAENPFGEFMPVFKEVARVLGFQAYEPSYAGSAPWGSD